MDWLRPLSYFRDQLGGDGKPFFAGSGTFSKAGELRPFAAGDVIFVEAGLEHRFESFSEDFETWVIFWGPEGGESIAA